MSRILFRKYLKNSIEYHNKKTKDKIKSTDESCDNIINLFLESLENQLENEKEFSLHGYLHIYRKLHTSREGVNPKTNEKITIPEYYRVYIKTGNYIKKIMRKI